MWLFLCKEYPSEDALTGALFDVLTWSASLELLKALLAATWKFDTNRTRPGSSLEIRSSTRFTVEPWPRWTAGEPDAVVRLFNGETHHATIVFEAKFGAGKSGFDGDGIKEGSASTPNEGDQLARYFACAAAEGVATTIVYLTHHVLPPEADLRASYLGMARRVPDAKPEQLRWLSWRHVEKLLREASLAHPKAEFGRCISSVARVLRNVGFKSFEGEWVPGTVRPATLPQEVWWWTVPKRPYRWSNQDLPLCSPRGIYTGPGDYKWTGPAGQQLSQRPNVLFWNEETP